jgi:hypothetical protein
MSKEENWDDKAFVLEKIQENCFVLRYSSKRLQDDEEVVMAAVKQDGAALRYASDRLKDNESIVLATVSKNGSALIFASDRLKENEEVVMVAVQDRDFALNYASARLRSDVNFCIECAKIDKNSSKYFMGEAKKIFQAHHNDIDEVEQVYTQQQQNKANEALLAKLSTGEINIPTNKLFKRKLLDV